VHDIKMTQTTSISLCLASASSSLPRPLPLPRQNCLEPIPALNSNADSGKQILFIICKVC